MKVANINREFLHIFWTTRGNKIKVSGKMHFKIILKVTKKQGSTNSTEVTFSKNHKGRVNLNPPSPIRVQFGPKLPKSSIFGIEYKDFFTSNFAAIQIWWHWF